MHNPVIKKLELLVIVTIALLMIGLLINLSKSQKITRSPETQKSIDKAVLYITVPEDPVKPLPPAPPDL